MNDHEKALAILDRDGWTQGMAVNHVTGAHCVMGCYQQAIAEELTDSVASVDLATTSLLAGQYPRLQQNYREFLQAIGLPDAESVPNGVISPDGNRLAFWNDNDARDDAEVREAFKKASELHELST